MDQTLAQIVRQKYPGAYDDLSDEDLEAKVDAKYPGAYSDFGRTKVQAATPAPGYSRPQTREDLEASQGLYGPVGAGDVLGGLGMAVPGSMEMLAGGAKAGATVLKAAPVVGSAARTAGRVLAHPAVAGPIGAAVGYARHGIPGAALGALEGMALGQIPGKAGSVLRALRGAGASKVTATAAAEATPEAIAAYEAAVQGARTVSPTLSNVTFTAGTAAKAAPIAAPVAKAAVTATAEAAPAVEAAVFHGDKVYTVGERIFNNAKEALEYSHSLKRVAVLASKAAPVAEKAAEVAPVAKAAATAAKAAPELDLPVISRGEKVGGLRVDASKGVPNRGSIESTLNDGEYTVLPGIRKVPISEFSPNSSYYAANDIARSKQLTETIRESKWVDPLIVVYEDAGPYILEGGHRLDALFSLGVKELPALVVDARTAAASIAAKALPVVSKAVPSAAASAARHSALVQFAKDAVVRNPKIGEKIWVALDKAGNPVKILTPDQAGALKRAGGETTWVRNLWR